MTEVPASGVQDSGAVAGRDVHLVGTYVAGRDLVVHQHLEQPVAAPTGIHQLPGDIIDFTGRDDLLREGRSWLLAAAADGRRAAPLLAISGKAGVGKTTFAVHLAHELAERYPDGQFHVNLRGIEAERQDPMEVLGGFLRAFGIVGAALPRTLAERATLFREFLHGRRALLLLDNAGAEAQVRPLLPGSAGCAVIVTSRQPLAGLEGARMVTLDVMTSRQSTQLLAGILGEARTAAEPDAAEEIAERCGHLPLALRIAGARLAARPRWTLARLAGRLRDQSARLTELKAGDLEVRAAFALSYDALAEPDRRAFRRLGLVRAHDFGAWAAAAVLDTDIDEAEEAVERLTDAQLLDSDGDDATRHPRYRFHDLLRGFARERLAAEEPAEDVEAARDRLLGAYLALSKRGLYLLAPNSKRDPLASRATPWCPDGLEIDELMRPTPFTWFLVETQAITAAVSQAFEAQRWDLTWELADPLHFHCRVLALWRPWVATHELALEAARLAQNRRGEAWILRNLGNAYRDQGLPGKATACYEDALRIGRELGSRLIEAAALNGAGEVSLDRGRLDTARAYFEEALTAWADVDDRTGVAYGHTHLAAVYVDQGLLDQAGAHAVESVRLQREYHDLSGEGYGRWVTGHIHRRRGELPEAIAEYQRCLDIYRENGEPIAAANTKVSLADVYADQRRFDEAVPLLDQALATYREFGSHRSRAIALTVLAATERRQGRLVDAARHLEEALPPLRDADDALGEARALTELGRVRSAADTTAARETLRAAIERYEAVGTPEIEDARALLAGLG
jgi:tetratricopeptide (TPR) repeat protein